MAEWTTPSVSAAPLHRASRSMFVDGIAAVAPEADPFTVVIEAVPAVASAFFPADRRDYSDSARRSSTPTPACGSVSC